MYDACGGNSTRIILANLEVWRIGNNNIEILLLGLVGEEPAEEPQCLGVREHEIRCLDFRRQCDSGADSAPIDEVIEHGTKRGNQLRINFIDEKLNCNWLIPRETRALRSAC
jgi:hypothetical protein